MLSILSSVFQGQRVVPFVRKRDNGGRIRLAHIGQERTAVPSELAMEVLVTLLDRLALRRFSISPMTALIMVALFRAKLANLVVQVDRRLPCLEVFHFESPQSFASWSASRRHSFLSH